MMSIFLITYYLRILSNFYFELNEIEKSFFVSFNYTGLCGIRINGSKRIKGEGRYNTDL